MIRYFARFSLLLLLCAPLSLPVLAGEALVNSDVVVEAEGKDAADAKSQAMAKAETDALIDLLSKLTPSGQAQDIAATLDARKISALVKGKEVLEEKIGERSYRARMLVSFDADEISTLVTKYTTGSGKDELPIVTGSFLIIPTYEDGNTVILWDESNPWRAVWKSLSIEINSGDIVVPYGDATDAGVIDAQTIASANFSVLAPLTGRYGVSDIVVLQARFVSTPDMVLTVVKRRVNRVRNEVNMLTFRADPQETRDMLFTRAARDIISGLQDKKTEEISTVQGVRGGERNKVMVLASITTLASWTGLREKLSTLPMIDKIELLAMSPQQVDMVLHYRGTPESLAGALTASQIRLVQNKDYWVISRD